MYGEIKRNLKESEDTLEKIGLGVKKINNEHLSRNEIKDRLSALVDEEFDWYEMDPEEHLEFSGYFTVNDEDYEFCIDFDNKPVAKLRTADGDVLYESQKLKEAIEQRYEKSNNNYNSFLRDVKHYTGSYDYLYGGKTSAEWNGYPITVNYFYYNRPYANGGYNLEVNVVTPMGTSGGWIQEEIEKEFERNSKTRLSNREIKDKINQILSTLDERY